MLSIDFGMKIEIELNKRESTNTNSDDDSSSHSFGTSWAVHCRVVTLKANTTGVLVLAFLAIAHIGAIEVTQMIRPLTASPFHGLFAEFSCFLRL